jgi:cell cycle serine/threonine-protein kinase CDC5/MSD2
MFPSSYIRIPQAVPPPPVQRRHPLANAANIVNHQETPPKPLPKAPASPPLPRQNPKVTPPSPPKIITDKSGKLQFHRVGFLGEVCGLVVQIGKLCVSDEILFRVVLHGSTK